MAEQEVAGGAETEATGSEPSVNSDYQSGEAEGQTQDATVSAPVLSLREKLQKAWAEIAVQQHPSDLSDDDRQLLIRLEELWDATPEAPQDEAEFSRQHAVDADDVAPLPDKSALAEAAVTGVRRLAAQAVFDILQELRNAAGVESLTPLDRLSVDDLMQAFGDVTAASDEMIHGMACSYFRSTRPGSPDDPLLKPWGELSPAAMCATRVFAVLARMANDLIPS